MNVRAYYEFEYLLNVRMSAGDLVTSKKYKYKFLYPRVKVHVQSCKWKFKI